MVSEAENHHSKKVRDTINLFRSYSFGNPKKDISITKFCYT